MLNVSKEIFPTAIKCLTLAWLMRTGEIVDTPTWGDRFRMEQGIEIGRRARELYPKGVPVSETETLSAEEKTKSLMEDPTISTIFEASFQVEGYSTKADILRRKSDGWHLIEVKSSVNDKDEFIDDMAFTAMVILQSGINISGASILLISRDFRLGMENEKLFVEIDHTQEVMERIKEFKPLWEKIEKSTRSPVKPEPQLQFECRKCELFREYLGREVKNHIFGQRYS